MTNSKFILKRVLNLFLLFMFLNFSSCQSGNKHKKENIKPNILWIYLEDTSPLMGCYGNDLVSTPNIDKLASDGMIFHNTIMPAPVSSPCRSSLITGMMATTFGAHNHHSSRTEDSKIFLPEGIKTLPEIMKEEGYFTFNNGKDDYNFEYDRFNLYSQDYYEHPIYGKSGERLKIEELKSKQPFFGQIQLYGGKEIFSSKFKSRIDNPVDRKKIKLPPYLPEDDIIIEEYANHLDAIQLTDKRLGEIINNLESANLLKNTIIIFFSDHGMRLTRHKQFLYDGGIKVPLIIKAFDKDLLNKNRENDLVSGLDITATTLGFAGIKIPDYFEGQDIFSSDYKERKFVISVRDRCDFSIDRIRSLRTKQFKYIRNFMPGRPYLQKSYMDVDNVPFVKRMKELFDSGKLNELQSKFFAEQKPSEELYDLVNDPYEINNLVNDESYKSAVNEFKNELNNWIIKTDDKGQYPEEENSLKFMYGIWGEHVENPEYEILKEKYQNFGGSLFHLKSSKWKKYKLKE